MRSRSCASTASGVLTVSSLTEVCDDRRVRALKTDRKERTKSAAEIFSGHGDTFTAVGGEHSKDLRLSAVHFKDSARNRCHMHTTDQNRQVREGDGFVDSESGE